jgi:galactonate dehydratase
VFPRIREFFEAARDAVGPDFGLALDCHGRLNLKAAIRLCRESEPVNLMFIEEPVPPENHDVLAEVSRNTATPIAAGERWATVHGVRPFLEAQSVDILRPDTASE